MEIILKWKAFNDCQDVLGVSSGQYVASGLPWSKAFVAHLRGNLKTWHLLVRRVGLGW